MSNGFVLKPLPFTVIGWSSVAAGYDPANMANDHMGVVWKSAGGSANQAIIIDLGADTAIDTLVLTGCTGAQPEWTLYIAAGTEAQGASFSPEMWQSGALPFLAGAVMPVSGRGRSLWMAPTVGGPPPSRYIFLNIDGLSGAAVTIARIVIGKRVQLGRNFSFGAAFGVRDLGNADFSPRGVFLRRRGAKLRSVGLTFSSVYKDEVEAVVHPLIETVGLTEPVALVTDPDPDDQRQNRIWFGPMVGDLGTVWTRASGFEWRANVVSLDA
ncbi:MAG: hypothetical protein U5M50_03925 [Sphingobium sp.]|nr:hypothetical protein [Sphingobium sp.]